MEKLLLLNAGLDVAYMAGGLYLRERGRRTSSDRLHGYGRSLLLQGGFLMVFDVVLFLVHHQHLAYLQPLLQGLQAGPNGIGWHYRF